MTNFDYISRKGSLRIAKAGLPEVERSVAEDAVDPDCFMPKLYAHRDVGGPCKLLSSRRLEHSMIVL